MAATRMRPPHRASRRPARLVLAIATMAAAAGAGCEQLDRNAVGNTRTAANATYEEARRLDEAGDDADAVRLYREAATAGNAAAAYELGEAYSLGEGVEVDRELAADWFNRAAAGGSPRGQYLLGRAYADGHGVPKDPAKATQLFAEAAMQGHAAAQYRLGRAFANGIGVPQDRLWAGRWYAKAGRQGNVDAQFAYGAMLAAGKGVPRDLELGYAYLKLAADNGVQDANPLLTPLRNRLSPAQRQSAERLIADIQAQPRQTFADKPTVRYLQAALAGLGFDAGPADGQLGPRTRAGVEAYQRAHGLEPDGELDSELLRHVLENMRSAA